MSPVTIGLLAHTANVGAALFGPLYEAHKKGDVKFVILHRPGSDVSKVPFDVDKRVVELDEGKVDAIRDAMRDLEVVISAVGFAGLKSQSYLVQALAGSPSLKTFFPSDFGAVCTEEELAVPVFSVFDVKDEVVARAKELGVPVTEVKVGIFDLFFFAYNALGTDIRANKVQYFRKSLEKPIHITYVPCTIPTTLSLTQECISLAYLGHAVTQLITSPSSLAKLPNSQPNFYDLVPTGNQLVSALEKVHGFAPEKYGFKEEQYKESFRDLFAAIGAALLGSGVMVTGETFLRLRWRDGRRTVLMQGLGEQSLAWLDVYTLDC
ncbi:hypothetical protein IAR50_003774 [Cryptococcus sp. DSM 104548]